MPEHIRALIVVLVLSAAVLYAVRPALIQVIPASTYDRWRKLWFFITLAWFLSGNVWIYVALVVVVLSVVKKRESHVFGLYLLLLFAAPSAHVPIPGFGLIEHLFMLDHYRLISLTLLLPVALSLAKDAHTVRFGQSPVDWMVFGYLVLTWVLTFSETGVTNGLRTGVLQFIDGWLPYYVASRSLKSIDDLRNAMTGILIGALLLSVLGVFEVLRSWKLYMASIAEYGLRVNQAYKLRGPFIRPGASVQDSIVLGTSVVFGMCVLLSLKERISGRFQYGVLWMILVMGLLASLSRAPWLSGILLVLIFYGVEGKGARSMLMVGLISVIVGFVLSFFPSGNVILDLLPFVGQSEQGSIDYRMNWFSASAPVIERNLFFGSIHAIGAPELEVMRNGEGIIDLVNTFLAVLLYYGLAGFFLFVGVFLLAIRTAWRAQRFFRKRNEIESSFMGQAMIAAICSLMFILITLSLISVVPLFLWTLAGCSAAYGFIASKRMMESALDSRPSAILG
jgi:O-antigen ligase